MLLNMFVFNDDVYTVVLVSNEVIMLSFCWLYCCVVAGGVTCDAELQTPHRPLLPGTRAGGPGRPIQQIQGGDGGLMLVLKPSEWSGKPSVCFNQLNTVWLYVNSYILKTSVRSDNSESGLPQNTC